MKSLILALIVVANFYFIESVNANCNPARRLFGKASGCENTIIESSPSTDNQSHFAVMPHDYQAERRREQEQQEILRNDQARIERYRQQQQWQQQEQERARLQEQQLQQQRVRAQEQQQELVRNQWVQQQNNDRNQGRQQQQSNISNVCQTNMNWCRIGGGYPVGTQCWCTYQYQQVYGQIVSQ